MAESKIEAEMRRIVEAQQALIQRVDFLKENLRTSLLLTKKRLEIGRGLLKKAGMFFLRQSEHLPVKMLPTRAQEMASKAEYIRYLDEFGTTVSGFDEYCRELFESEAMEKLELPKFRKFKM